METTEQGKASERSAPLVQTRQLLEEMERLELRARMLLTEHRHVVETIRDMQRQVDAAGDSG